MKPSSDLTCPPNNCAQPESGSALALALIAITGISILGAGMVKISGSFLKRQTQGIASIRAMYIAEAGLAEAYLAIAQGRSGVIGLPDQPAAFGGGVYWVEAQPVGESQVSLSAHGLYDTGRFSIGATLERRVHPIGYLGLASSEETIIGAGASVTGLVSNASPGGKELPPGVDRPVGPPEHMSSAALPGARLSSHGDVYLDSQAAVIGDVQYGTQGMLFIEPGASHSGASESYRREDAFPQVPVPVVDEAQVAIGAASLNVGIGSHSFTAIDVQGNAHVVLTGPSIIVTEQLHLRPGGSLSFDSTEGAVELHVLGSASFGPGSQLDSPEGQSASVGLFLHGAPSYNTNLSLDSAGVMHGIVYAPSHSLVVGEDLQITGALLARSVELAPGAQFVFDEATIIAAVGLPALPRQVAWYLLPLSEEPIMRNQRNVNAYLDQAGVVATPSAQASAEQDLVLHYLNDLGVEEVFQGHASLVDWSKVAGIRNLAWVDEDSQATRSFDKGLGLFSPVADVALMADALAGGGIRGPLQGHIQAWPAGVAGFLVVAQARAPFTQDEIDAFRSLVPAPTVGFLTDLEDAHLAAGGGAW